MDGRAFTLHAYANIKHGFAQTEKFSQCTPHIDLIIVVPQWSCTTAMLKNITENVFRTTFQAALFSLSSLVWLFFSTSWCPNQFQLLSVWEGTDSLKSMAVWLEISLQGIMRQWCCYDYYAMLPLPAYEIMVELKDTILDPSQHNVINHTHPLDIRTNNLTFRA